MATQLNLGDDQQPDRRVGVAERRDEIPLSQWTALGNVIVKVGVPSAIALYLVYEIVTGFNSKMDAHAAESRRDSLRALRVLQQICVNTATTPEARGGCLSWTFEEAR